jgi:hypothetical protein
MLKRIILATTTVAMLGMMAPVAHAAIVEAKCYRFVAVDSEERHGFTAGYALFDDSATHSLRCEVRLNGVVQASSIEATGEGFITTEGTVDYFAEAGAFEEICVVIDNRDYSCESTAPGQSLPQEVTDAIDRIFVIIAGLERTADTLICPVLGTLSPGIAGVIDITPEGDATIIGFGPFWDCPPYGNLFPPAPPV